MLGLKNLIAKYNHHCKFHLFFANFLNLNFKLCLFLSSCSWDSVWGHYQRLECKDQKSGIFSEDLLTINWTLTNVRFITIIRQKLIYLTIDMLPPYPLKFLELNDNLITKVYLRPSLLQKQQIPALHKRWWIEVLRLENNPISQFYMSDDFGVQYLALCDCEIESLNPQNFHFSKHISQVNLRNNKIKTISDEYTTQSFSNLDDVDMRENQMSYVDFNCLPASLDLRFNEITFFRTKGYNLQKLHWRNPYFDMNVNS